MIRSLFLLMVLGGAANMVQGQPYININYFEPYVQSGFVNPTIIGITSPNEGCLNSIKYGTPTCRDCIIDLKGTFSTPGTDKSYVWQVYDPAINNWRDIPNSNTLELRINLEHFSNLNDGNAQFRLVVRMPSGSAYSSSKSINLAPRAPVFLHTAEGEFFSPPKPSCPELDNGEFYFTYIGLNVNRYLEYSDGMPVLNPQIDLKNGIISDLAPGDYTFYLTNTADRGECKSQEAHFTILEYPPLTLSKNSTNISCPGASDGEIILTASGGDTNRTLTFTEIATPTRIANNTIKYTGVAPGAYDLQVSDSGCHDPVHLNVTLKEPAALSADFDITSLTCKESPNGAILLSNVIGGIAGETNNFKYFLYNSHGLVKTAGPTTSRSYNFTGLSSGTYTVEIEYQGRKTCARYSVDRTVPDYSFEIDNPEVTHLKCAGFNHGSMKVKATKGSGSYLFSINGPVNRNNASGEFNNLPAGNYSLNVKDANGCGNVQTENFTINTPSPLKVELNRINHVTCYGGSNGSVSVNVSGGTAAYKYEWYKSGGSKISNSKDLSNVVAGTYLLKIIDANNCTITSENFKINQPSDLMITASIIKHVRCYGEANGQISVSSSGGTGTKTIEYKKNSGSWVSFNNTMNLGEGTYRFRVKDQNNCSKDYSSPLQITAPAAALKISSITKEDITCNGLTNGKIHVNVSGGDGGASNNNFKYDLDNSRKATTGNSYTFTGLGEKAYQVKVIDSRGCTVTASRSIIEPAPVSSSVSGIVNNECFGDNAGSITLYSNGGTGSYYYSINNSAYQSSNVFSNLRAGQYIIKVKDSNNCFTNNIEVQITQPNAPISISINSFSEITCHNGTNGSIDADFSGGNGNYLLQWQKLGGGRWNNIAGKTTRTISNLNSGSYRLKIYNNAGGDCSYFSEVVNLSNPNILKFQSVSIKQIRCKGESNGKIIPSATGGWGGYKFYYGRNGGAKTNQFTGSTNLPPGNYRIRVVDKEGCVVNYEPLIKITEPAANLAASEVLSNFNGSNISCYGAGDAKITITPTGGNGSPFDNIFQFKLNNGSYQNSNIFSGLGAGSYSYTVKDQRGCEISKSFTLTRPERLTIQVAEKTNANCYNSKTGSITVSPEGGTTPYQFSLNGGSYQSSSEFNNLYAGHYTIVVKDKNGCIANVSTQVESPNQSLSISVTKQDLTCHNQNDGFINTSVSGGWGEYSYQWKKLQGNQWQPVSGSGNSLTNLNGGSYKLIITDQSGCQKETEAIEIVNPDPIAFAEVEVIQVTCKGENNGRIILNVNGGWGNHLTEYSRNGSIYTEFDDETLLMPGEYVIRTTDIKGCSKAYSETIEIHEPDEALNFTYTTSDFNGFSVSCFGHENGKILISPTGGNGGSFQNNYKINFGSGFKNDLEKDSLLAGTYKVYLKDQRGCEIFKNIVITEPESLEASVSEKENIKCFGDSSGFVQIYAKGGVTPYSYQQNDYARQATNSFQNLTEGSYSFKVIDDNGCSVAINDSILQPYDSIHIDITVKDVSCYLGNDGSLQALVSGGSGQYTYLWNNSTNFSTIDNLSAGTYSVKVTDDEGCSKDADAVIVEPEAALTANIQKKDLQCFEDGTGQIIITASGGTEDYKYSIHSGGFMDQNHFDSLSAGKYIVKIRDHNNCEYEEQLEIIQPTAVGLQIKNLQDAFCHGDSTGMIGVASHGGVGNFQYNISGSEFYQDSIFTNLSAGDYTISAIDSNHCLVTEVIAINHPDPLSISFETTPVICKGDNTGSISLNSGGGTGNYVYEINGGIVNPDTLFNLYNGDYAIKLTDSNNCQLDTVFSIIEPDEQFAISQFSKEDITCYNNNDGKISLTVEGGYGNYSYSHNNESIFEPLILTGLPVGTHHFIATDSIGCTDSISINLSEPELLEISIDARKNILCNADSTGMVELSAKGGNGNYTFIGNNQPNVTGVFENLSAREHLFYVNDPKGCTDSISVLLEEPSPVLHELQGIINSACGQANGEAKIAISGGVPDYEVNWYKNDTIYTSGYASASLKSGRYLITINDANQCESVVPLLINDDEAPAIDLIKNTPVSCYLGSDGEIEISASGGSGQYYFLWSDSLQQAEPLAKNLKAGDYQIRVEDSRGCVTTKQYIVESPDQLRIILESEKQPSCSGSDDGELYFNAEGGNNGYTFFWDVTSGDNVGSARGLSSGIYNIEVVDDKGCKDSIQYELDQPKPITVDSTFIVSPTCFGMEDGMLQPLINGGTGKYLYYLNDVPFIDPDFVDLSTGEYELLIRDENGCELISHYFINEPDILTISIDSLSDALCYNSADGFAEVSSSGGNGDYKFKWPGLNNNKNYSDNLLKGNYWIHTYDKLGCKDSVEVFVDAPQPISIDVIYKKLPSCYNYIDGEIQVRSNGGFGNFTYEWNSKTGNSTVKELSSGIYSVKVTDENQCFKIDTIVLGQPDPVVVSLQKTKMPSCYGLSDGFLTLKATGGTGSYSYKHENITFEGSTLFNLEAGEYVILAEDSNGCKDTGRFEVGEPEPLKIILSEAVEPLCHTSDEGSLYVEASGGNSGYIFNWTEGNLNGPLISNIGKGSYTVALRDSLNCTTDTTFTLSAPAQLKLDLIKHIEPECNDDCSGIIEFFTFGGTKPYNFSWEGISKNSSPAASNLCAGIYSFSVQDKNGCALSDEIALDNPSDVQLITIEKTSPSCKDATDGSIKVAGVGGTAPYTYEWLDSGIKNNELRNIPQGIYKVIVTDAFGCSKIESLELTAPKLLEIEVIKAFSPNCSYTCDGYAEVQATGGTGPYSYHWDDPQQQAGSSAVNLCPGKYSVTVTDKNGCSTIIPVTIEETESINLDIGDSRTLCKDQTVTLDPKIDDLTYSWTSTTNFESIEKTITISDEGLYYLKATNAKGCIARDTFEIISSEEEFEVNFLAASELITGDTLLLTEVCYPMADYLEWEFDEALQVIEPSEWQPQVSSLKAGVFPVNLTAYKGDCYATVTKNITFYDPDEAPELSGRIMLGETGFKDIRLYPNPTKGEINIHVILHNAAPLAAFIYDSYGKEVARSVNSAGISHRLYFNIEKVRSGSYFLKLISNNSIGHLKILKTE